MLLKEKSFFKMRNHESYKISTNSEKGYIFPVHIY